MLAAAGCPRPPLYALRAGAGFVFINEGEPDAISMACLGLSVIGAPGAGGTPRPEWLEPVRGLIAVVMLDNDKAGRDGAQRWATAALGVARGVRVVELGGPTGYDVGDLVCESRHDLDAARRRVLELAERAPAWTPPASTEAPTTDTAPPTHQGALITITASTVMPRAAQCLWEGWIPLGMVSLLAGLPGLGNTTLALRLAAYATRGELEGGLEGEPVDVLVASLEDVIDARLVPLLIATGADLDRVHFVACQDAGRMLDLTKHLTEIDRLADRHNARLLFIDPLVAAMPAGEISSHRDQDVRSVLAPLHALAERHDLAVLGSMHFAKSAVDALLGVGGSIGFTGLARSLLIFGADPNDERGEEGPSRVLAHRKCNVGPRQRSRQCWIQPNSIETDDGRTIETSYAMLGDECDVSADELVRIRDRNEPPIVQATRFLRQLLADGPHAVQEIRDLSEDERLSWRTVERAKRDLDLDAFQKDRKWWWMLVDPDDDGARRR